MVEFFPLQRKPITGKRSRTGCVCTAKAEHVRYLFGFAAFHNEIAACAAVVYKPRKWLIFCGGFWSEESQNCRRRPHAGDKIFAHLLECQEGDG